MPSIAAALGLDAFAAAWKLGFREGLVAARVRAGDPPRPSFWMVTLVRNGPEVPARVYRPCPIEMDPRHWEPLDRVFHLEAEVGGRPVPVTTFWSMGRAREIDHKTFTFEMDDMAWAIRWAPHEPKANPRKPVDWLANQIPLF